MSKFEGQIDESQKKIEKSIKEDSSVLDDGAKKTKAVDTYLKKVDSFQQNLNENVKDSKLQDEWNEKVLGFLKQATSPADIEKLQSELESALKNYEAAIKKYAEWKKSKYEVKDGDNLSMIVEKELGVKWKEDPMQHFAIIESLQKQRTDTGSVAVIDSHGNFLPEKVTKTSKKLDIGEFLDLKSAQSGSEQSVEAIRKYADDNPTYKKELYKLADEFEAKSRLQSAGDKAPEDKAIAEGTESALRLEAKKKQITEAAAAFKTRSDDAQKINISEGFEDNLGQTDFRPWGYVSVLQRAITAVEDTNSIFSSDEDEKEKLALDNIRNYTKVNLDAFNKTICAPDIESGDDYDTALDKAKFKQDLEASEDYKKAEKIYVQDAKTFISLSAQIDENYENSNVRNIRQAMEMANSLLPHMDLKEATDWTKSISAQIDENQFQSGELTADYQQLFEVVKSHLKAKLEAEKPQAGAEGYDAYAKKCLDMAEFFSGRSAPIDSALCDSEWARQLAAEAANTDKIYLQMLIDEKNILPGMKALEGVFDELKTESKDYLSSLLAQGMDVAEPLAVLNAPINSIEALSGAWTVICYCQYGKDGENPSQEQVQQYVAPQVEASFKFARTSFMEHLRSDDVRKDASYLSSELGVKLDDYQIKAVDLLNDIDGTGWFNPSDASVGLAAEGAKIAAAIAAGIAVGVATCGMGWVAAALAGGLAMTASNAAINQQGFEDRKGGIGDAYGKDMAVNTLTMGAGRVVTAGGKVYLLNKAGGLSTMTGPEARAILWASTKGGRNGIGMVNSLDDGLKVTGGQRFMAAGAEGIADVAVGTVVDTGINGGTFAENFQNNAMFFGLGIGMEMGGHYKAKIAKKVDGASDAELSKIKSANEESSRLRTDMSTFCKENNIDPVELHEMFKKGELSEEMKSNPDVVELKNRFDKAKEEFAAEMVEVVKSEGDKAKPEESHPAAETELNVKKTDLESLPESDADISRHLDEIYEMAKSYDSYNDFSTFNAIRKKIEAVTEAIWNRHIKPGDEVEISIEGQPIFKLQFTGETKVENGNPVFEVIRIPGGEKQTVGFSQSGDLILYTFKDEQNWSSEIIRAPRSSRVLNNPDLSRDLDKLNSARRYFDSSLKISSEAKGSFEPADRLLEIRKIPKGPERDAAIEAYRKERDLQKQAMAEVPDRVRTYLNEHPDAPPWEVMENVFGGPEGELRFSADQRAEMKTRILDYMRKRNNVRKYAEQYKDDPKVLVSKIFEINPYQLEGEITMEVHEGNLFFNCKNSSTYYKLYGNEAAPSSGGFAAIRSEIPELKGAVTVGNNVTDRYKLEVMDHEIRHQENKLLFPEHTIDKAKAYTPLSRAKDEIIAYLRDGSSRENIIKYLTEKDGLYDYYKAKREKAGSPDEIRKIDKEWEQHCKDVERLVDIAFLLGKENIDLLSITSHAEWGNIRVIDKDGNVVIDVKAVEKTHVKPLEDLVSAGKTRLTTILKNIREKLSLPDETLKRIDDFIDGAMASVAEARLRLATIIDVDFDLGAKYEAAIDKLWSLIIRARKEREILLEKNPELKAVEADVGNKSGLDSSEVETDLELKVKRTESHAERFERLKSDPNLPEGTRKILEQPWAQVEHSETIDGHVFHFGPVIDNAHDGYLECFAFVETDKGLQPRLFYKSNSDGGWRSTPYTFLDPYTRKTIYSKGEESGGHYTQTTKPVEAVAGYLDRASAKGTVKADFVINDYYNIWGNVMDNSTAFQVEIQSYKPEADMSSVTRLKPGGRKERNNIALSAEELRSLASGINYPEGFVPEFSQDNVVNTYVKNHTMLGECNVRVYEASLDGRPVEWHMAVDKEGRVWVDAIKFKNGKTSSFGTVAEVIDSGILTSKPIEYDNQAYGVLGTDFFAYQPDYVDQTPFLENLRPIQEFRAAMGIPKPGEAEQVKMAASGDMPSNSSPPPSAPKAPEAPVAGPRIVRKVEGDAVLSGKPKVEPKVESSAKPNVTVSIPKGAKAETVKPRSAPKAKPAVAPAAKAKTSAPEYKYKPSAEEVATDKLNAKLKTRIDSTNDYEALDKEAKGIRSAKRTLEAVVKKHLEIAKKKGGKYDEASLRADLASPEVREAALKAGIPDFEKRALSAFESSTKPSKRGDNFREVENLRSLNGKGYDATIVESRRREVGLRNPNSAASAETVENTESVPNAESLPNGEALRDNATILNNDTMPNNADSTNGETPEVEEFQPNASLEGRIPKTGDEIEAERQAARDKIDAEAIQQYKLEDAETALRNSEIALSGVDERNLDIDTMTERQANFMLVEFDNLADFYNRQDPRDMRDLYRVFERINLHSKNGEEFSRRLSEIRSASDPDSPFNPTIRAEVGRLLDDMEKDALLQADAISTRLAVIENQKNLDDIKNAK